jgi:Cdc6-like AAA superfamily ATPase
MRRFSSYGPVDKDHNYYAPRLELIERAKLQLLGENPEKGGHYITVWAPRQTGKSWTMREILWILQKDERFDVLKINLEHLKMEEDVNQILSVIGKETLQDLNKEIINTDSPEKFQSMFEKGLSDKPLILIFDEFDALAENAISAIVGVFRNIYNINRDQLHLPLEQRKYLVTTQSSVIS